MLSRNTPGRTAPSSPGLQTGSPSSAALVVCPVNWTNGDFFSVLGPALQLLALEAQWAGTERPAPTAEPWGHMLSGSHAPDLHPSWVVCALPCPAPVEPESPAGAPTGAWASVFPKLLRRREQAPRWKSTSRGHPRAATGPARPAPSRARATAQCHPETPVCRVPKTAEWAPTGTLGSASAWLGEPFSAALKGVPPPPSSDTACDAAPAWVLAEGRAMDTVTRRVTGE